MKRSLYISLLFCIVITANIRVVGQDLPSACVGNTEKYWVKGFNGHSDFTWQITDPDGNIVPPSNYTLVGRGDTVQVQWGSNFKGGIYTFTVTELSDYGCIGVPYSQDIVLNSPTINVPFAGVPTTVAICYGSIAALDPGSFINYLWQDGSTNQIYYTGEAGTYQVRLIDDNQNCSYNDIEAVVNPLPLVWLGNDTVLFGNQILNLDVTKTDIDFYEWSTGSIASSITVDGQSGNQSIWVKVTDNNGCKNSDTINIKAADYDNLRIPAAFTPNGDGINDKWQFPAPVEGMSVSLYFTDITVRVFNRWGKLVWESSGTFKEWDGKDLNGRELPMDSYHYLIKFKVGEKSHTYKGSITIVR